MSDNALKLSQLAGKSSFTINRPCDRTQLLVTLKRNKQKWLSPIGWVGAEKGTLLDCSALGELTQIDIPEEFAREMENGDVLSFSSYELDIEGESLVWSTPSKTSKGLFGRLRGKAAEEQVDAPALNKFELQAAAAHKTADEMRAKMEAAQKAKEAAHARAMEAARLAEEACVVEESRIAEMQAATQQLEEAEELRRQELERIKEEHRLEQERRLEEARLAEEARQREIARRRKEELMAKRTELSSQLGHISDKRVHEEKYVQSLNGDIENLNIKAEKSTATTTRIETKLSKVQGVLAKQVQKLSTANDETLSLESDKRAASQEVETASSAEQYLLSDLHKAQLANDKAEQAVQEAMAHAKLTKARAEKAEEDRKAGTATLVNLQSHMAKIESALKAANDRHQIVKTHFETAKSDAATAQSNYDAAQSEKMELQAEYKSRQAELTAAMVRLEAVHIQEHVTKSAIDLIDDDADMDVVQDLLANTPAELIAEAKQVAAQTERPSFLGSLKRKAAKAQPAPQPVAELEMAPVLKAAALVAAPAAMLTMSDNAETSEDVIEIPTDKDENKTVPARANVEVKSQETKTQESASEGSKTGSRLYVSAAAISVLAIGGLALSKNIPVSATPQPTEAASFKPAVDTKKSFIKTAAADIPAQVKLTLETPALEMPVLGTSNPEQEVKSEKVEAKPTLVEAPKKIAPKKTDTVKVASLKKITPKVIEPKISKKTLAIVPVQTEAYSLQTRMDMQLNLSKLGFYSSDISGTIGPKTKTAIIEFKQLFGMPSGSEISDAFLAELKSAVESSEQRAEQERLISAAKQEQAVLALAQPVVPTPVPEFASTPVVQPQPVAESVFSAEETPARNARAAADPVAEAVQASGTVTQTASLTTTASKAVLPIEEIAKPILAPTPEKIVEAKRINAATANYPGKALRRGFEKKVYVDLRYDVNEEGKPMNLRVETISDVPKTYKEAFEKAGLNSIKKMRFSPKTVNGTPTFSKDNKTRITFQTR